MRCTISVISVVLNSAATIGGTIDSVSSQSHKLAEYLVVDCGSTDGTQRICDRRSDEIDRFVSEADRGVFDAMSKGIRRATGKVIGFLNSDDTYADPDVLSDVADAFSSSQIDVVYGDLVFVKRSQTNRLHRYRRSSPYRRDLFLRGWMPPYPTFFARRRLFESFGGFRTDLWISAGYQFMLRFMHVHKVRAAYLSRALVAMRVGSQSNRSIRNGREAFNIPETSSMRSSCEAL